MVNTFLSFNHILGIFTMLAFLLQGAFGHEQGLERSTERGWQELTEARSAEA